MDLRQNGWASAVEKDLCVSSLLKKGFQPRSTFRLKTTSKWLGVIPNTPRHGSAIATNVPQP